MCLLGRLVNVCRKCSWSKGSQLNIKNKKSKSLAKEGIMDDTERLRFDLLIVKGITSFWYRWCTSTNRFEMKDFFNVYFKVIQWKERNYSSIASCTLLALLNFVNMTFQSWQISRRYTFMDISAVFTLLVWVFCLW